jgi:prevent-host-death family protein
VQVNMLEAKNQLSRLVKAAQAGEEVIIASHGKPQVKLVPCESPAGLRDPGALVHSASPLVDEAFGDAVDRQVSRLMGL